MSHENVALARRVLDALGRRDAEELVALSDPRVEWHSFFALNQGGAYQGHDGTRQYMRDLADAFEVGRAEVDDALGIDDVTLLVGHLVYRGRGSGAEGATPAGWMLKFREGKLVHFQAFRDPAQAVEAVGLSE